MRMKKEARNSRDREHNSLQEEQTDRHRRSKQKEELMSEKFQER